MQKFKVNENDVGSRLDVFLSLHNQSITRSQIKNAIDGKSVFVNGKIVKAGYKVCLSDEIEMEAFIKEIHAIAEQMDIDIIYEDDDLAVINKKQGVVVHAGNGNKNGTLVNGLLYKFGSLAKNENDKESIRPGIVHRIDKDTSGLLVVAKSSAALKSLSEQIAKHTCKREYLAMCSGIFKDTNKTIDTNIARDKKNKIKMAVCKNSEGKNAITHYNVIQQFNNCAYVHFVLETGRTHQIRVHCAYINHPIIGDAIYGKVVKSLNGQLLHAFKLSFVHPVTQKDVTFEAPLPDYFTDYLKKQSSV